MAIYSPPILMTNPRMQPQMPGAYGMVDASSQGFDMQTLLGLLALIQGDKRSTRELSLAEKNAQTEAEYRNRLVTQGDRQIAMAEQADKRGARRDAADYMNAVLTTRVGRARDQAIADATPQIRAQVHQEEAAAVASLAPYVKQADDAYQMANRNPVQAKQLLHQAVYEISKELNKLDGNVPSAAYGAGVSRALERVGRTLAETEGVLRGGERGELYEQAVARFNTLTPLMSAYPAGTTDQLVEALAGKYATTVTNRLTQTAAETNSSFYDLARNVGPDQALQEMLGKIPTAFDVSGIPFPSTRDIPQPRVTFGPMQDTSRPSLWDRTTRTVRDVEAGASQWFYGTQPVLGPVSTQREMAPPFSPPGSPMQAPDASAGQLSLLLNMMGLPPAQSEFIGPPAPATAGARLMMSDIPMNWQQPEKR